MLNQCLLIKYNFLSGLYFGTGKEASWNRKTHSPVILRLWYFATPEKSISFAGKRNWFPEAKLDTKRALPRSRSKSHPLQTCKKKIATLAFPTYLLVPRKKDKCLTQFECIHKKIPAPEFTFLHDVTLCTGTACTVQFGNGVIHRKLVSQLRIYQKYILYSGDTWRVGQQLICRPT